MNGLIVDNFAGGGGASTGIEAALGRAVDVAINHDAEAVAMHVANHPGTRHLCQSIMAIDPLDAVAGADGRPRKVRLAWFSPDCKHHSKAKGGKPREKNIRDLAWIVVHWTERLGDLAPDVICLENVEEFRHWGPLDAHGKPIAERKGEEFDLWVRRLRRLGYKVEWRELRACDYGAPTSRKRLYLVARRDRRPIAWPAPSHAKPGTPEVASGALLPWRTAAECIDWSRPCPSIFERARPLKEATLRRIAHGTMRFVVNAARPFIVATDFVNTRAARVFDPADPLRTTTSQPSYAAVDAGIVPITHSGIDGRAHSPVEPLRTVTTANGGEFARVAATLVQTGYGERPASTGKSAQAPRALDPQAPLGTVVAGGAKHAAVAAFLSAAYTSNTNGGRGKPDLPLKTVMAGGTHHSVVCAHVEQANTGMVGHPVAKPLSTIVGKGCTQRLVETTLLEDGALPPELLDKASRVAAFLVKYYGAGASQVQAADRPLDTVTTLARFAAVTVTIDAVTYVIVDIGMRMLTPRELARAQGFPDSYILDPLGPNGKPLSKSAQIRMIGNSVCPDVAAALVRAQLPDECALPEAEAA